MALKGDQALIKQEIEYPDTDGKPMAESDFQRKPLTYLVEALSLHFQARPDVYVSGNLLIYYEEGNPKASVAPDVFVVFGVPEHDRRIYQVWAEGKGPDVVIEITSRTTQARDEIEKPVLYRELGVQEYYQYDPSGDYLQPALRGRRLDEQGQYREMRGKWLSAQVFSLESKLLGLRLHLEEDRLRLFDPAKEAYLLTYAEEVKARQKAEAQAKALEAELERLRAKLGPDT